jgi:YD repeat-containing protein
LLAFAFTPLAEAEVLAPVLAPSTADSTVGIDVTITCGTPDAEIRYTLNGVDPILHDRPVATGESIRISRNAVLKVRAWAGTEASPVVTEDYRITGAVSSGYRHGLALSVAGRVWSWGEQGSGRLGNGNTASADISVPDRVLLPPANFELGAAIAAGYDHSLVIDQSGILWTFGENGSGQLGNNATTDSAVPVRVLQSTTPGDFIGPCIAADGGHDYSVALLSTGEVIAWGVQSTGRLGNGTNSSSSRKYAGPVKRGDDPAYPALTGIQAIAAGYAHGLAREPNASEVPAATGRVWVWGRNHVGQLGRGDTSGTTRAFPMLLDATTELTDALDLSGSGSHSVVVRWKDGDPALDGTVWSCGSQEEGRLGNGSTASGNLTYPVQAIKVGGAPLTGIRQVSAGTSYTLALDEDGHVWAWGSNDYGQLGDGTTVDNGHARQVKDAAGTGVLGDIVMISAGGENSRGLSLALAKDGTIWAWGSNIDGQLGNGQTSGISVLPVAHAQNHVAEGELLLDLDADVIIPQALGELSITANATHTDPEVEIEEVRIFRNGTELVPTEVGGTHCSDCGLDPGVYHIYATARDSNDVTVMSAAWSGVIFDPTDFVVTPLNGSASSPNGGSSEYWLADGETSIKLHGTLSSAYQDKVVTVIARDANGQILPVSVESIGSHRKISIGLYGLDAPLKSPVEVEATIPVQIGGTETTQTLWTATYRPRAVTWEISQPVSANNGTVTLPGTRFHSGEIARLVRSEGGNYKVRSTFGIDTFGDPAVSGSYEMTLRGLPDHMPQIAPGTQSHHDFNFKIPTFALSAPDIRLDLVRSSDDLVIRSTPVSLHGIASGSGIRYAGPPWKLSYDETTDTGYQQECGNCGNESGTETFSYIDREGSMCAAGYLSPDSTTDNKVSASYDLGTDAAGAGGMKADFKTDDLSDPGIASPENMELFGTESPQVTTDLGGTYAETIQTATGTTQVTDIQPDGYTLTFTGTGQSEPTTSLRLVRTELAANHWSLRFIEKRHLGTVVETRYEQTKHSDGSETWKILEGAELSEFNADPDLPAPENSFLRRTTILRSATAVVSVTPLLGTSSAPIPQFTEQVTVDEMTADTSAWETVSVTLNTFRVFPWGDPIVSQVLDPVTAANPAGRALTRRWDYYNQTGSEFGIATGGKMSDRPGSLAGFQDYDGFWQQLEWDGEGRIAKVRSPFLDSPSSAADTDCEVWTFTYGVNTRRDVHKIQGVSVSESIAEGVETLRSLQRLPSSAAGAWDPGNLITIIARAPVAAITDPNFKFAASSYRITIIVRPDETAHTCAWSYSGANLVKSCKDGNATLTKGTSTVTTSDLIGNAVSTVSGVLDFGGAAGTPQNLSTVTRDLLDPLGRPTRSTTSFTDGSPAQVETWTYSCCGILNSTDYRGILTNYHHDHLKRRESSTTLGVVHGTQYNGRERLQLRIPRALVPPGQVMSAERITFRGMASFPAGTILQGETTTNTAGETTLERSPSPQHSDGVTMVATTTAYSYLPNAITRNFPDGGQSVSTWTLDRRSRGSYGSAVDASGLAYSTTPQGNGSVFAETRYLGDYARSGQEYVTTGYDLLGRPVITLYPDGAFATMHYNDLGQLIKSVDPDGVTTLFAYNDEGERTHSAADLNGNGLLDLATDRVSFSETNAATAPDGITKTWETLSRVYREGDSGETGGLVAGRSYRSIDGLKSWSVPFGIAARTSGSVTVLGGNGAWTTTSVAADGLTTVSTTTGGLLRSSIVRGSNSVETVNSTTYDYDSHNRVWQTTDARTGATTAAFNNADMTWKSTQVRPLMTNLVTVFRFDSVGRTTSVESPDPDYPGEGYLTNVVHRTYDHRGNVLSISGEQTYDVEYTYDALSRMKTLTTRYGTANAGAGSPQTTTWNYHAQRGWLVEKNYPGESNSGPGNTADYHYTPGGRLRTRTGSAASSPPTTTTSTTTTPASALPPALATSLPSPTATP